MPVRSITLPAAPPAFSERFPRCGVTTMRRNYCRLPSRCVDAASSKQRGRPRDAYHAAMGCTRVGIIHWVRGTTGR
ncbi:unnamed protein product [Ectocarpus sp. 8 AP-2014]